MKKLILYTLLFISPFIVTIIVMEYLLRKIPNTHMIKAAEFKEEASKTQILILGNSHSFNAINPRYLSKEAYNLAQGAQTLDIDYALLSKYQTELESLEYVIVPISYQSFWTKLSEAEYFKWISKYNNIYFNVKIERNPLKTFIFLDEPIKKDLEYLKLYYWDKRPIEFKLTKGFMLVEPATDIKKIQEHGESTAKAYTVDDLNYLYSENLAYVKDIIDISRTKNSKVIFLTIPCYITYLDNINHMQLDLIHQTMNNLKNDTDVFYYDMLEDARQYNLEDFGNSDHLSYLGAKKVTMKLDSIIREIEIREIKRE